MTSSRQLLCYNKGCGNRFDPEENKEDSCLFHPGPPYFHDAYKIWKCCKKKSTDFSTWLSFPGCTRGPHNGEKPVDDTPKAVPEAQSQQPEKEEQLIIWNGLTKPAERNGEQRKRVLLPIQLTESAKEAIEKELRRRKKEEEEKEEQIGTNAPRDLLVGTACSNNACKAIFSGPESHEQECSFHPGNAIFHEGMKFWSCCERKTTDFGAFLDQQGCARGKHSWTKERVTTNLREDWFQRGGQVLISIYCKGPIPVGTRIDTDGLNIRAHISHAFGEKETLRDFELFGEVVPEESSVLISERKVEIVLKQVCGDPWPRLTFE